MTAAEGTAPVVGMPDEAPQEIIVTKQDIRRWERENRQLSRRQWCREVRCFFTRPFGHAYHNQQCVGCGRGYPLNF